MSGNESHDVDSPGCRPGTAPPTPPTPATTAPTTPPSSPATPLRAPTGCSTSAAAAATSPPPSPAVVPDGHVVGVDAQPSMLAEARKRGRAEPVLRRGRAAAARRRAASPEPRRRLRRRAQPGRPALGAAGRLAQVLASMQRLVRAGGWLRIECGGAGNVARSPARCWTRSSAAHGGPTAPWTFADAGDRPRPARGRSGSTRTPRARFVRTVAQRRPVRRGVARSAGCAARRYQAYEALPPTPRRLRRRRRGAPRRPPPRRRHLRPDLRPTRPARPGVARRRPSPTLTRSGCPSSC